MLIYTSLFLLTLVTVMTVGGDYFIKTATGHRAGMSSAFFVIGTLLYGLSSIGWFYLMRSHSLTWIAVSYSAATLIFVALLGVIVFGETLRSQDVVAVGLALLAVLLINHG